MSEGGIPEAESRDQSWMSPAVPPKRPQAEYSEFNPPPVAPSSRAESDDEAVVYLRRIYRFLIGAAIGGLVGLTLYLLFVA